MEAAVLVSDGDRVPAALACTELTEVLGSLRSHVSEQLEDQATDRRPSDRDVKEDDWIPWMLQLRLQLLRRTA